jgi:diaminopimelate decarboxylase
VLPGGRSGPATAGPTTIAGQLCTPKDVLAHGVQTPVAAGDTIVFALAGAYAWNISHRDFLLHPPPAILHTSG